MVAYKISSGISHAALQLITKQEDQARPIYIEPRYPLLVASQDDAAASVEHAS